MDIRKINIIECTRCGEYHDELDFKELSHPVVVGEKTYTHCASCPTNQEPILMTITILKKKTNKGRVLLMNHIRGFERISETQWLKDIDDPENYGNINDIILPKRATSHSAGYDIFSTANSILLPNTDILIPLGFKIYMLEDEFFEIHPRSGLGFKYYIRLANTTGIIDSDYYNNLINEGHCFAKIRNEGHITVIVKKGEAIAQGIFQKFLLVDGDSYNNGNTRNGGFGSTDSK